MKRTVQSILMLIALWGALLTIALRKGWEMPRWLSPAERTAASIAPPATDAATPLPALHDAGTPDTAAPVPDAAIDAPAPWSRYRVCASAAPLLSVVSLDERNRGLAIHCGDRLHLVHVPEQSAPTRIAALSSPTANPSERVQATALVSADVNADGLFDLLLPVLTTDEWQHARGRHVLMLTRETSGAFRAAHRVTAASPLSIVAGAIDTSPGTDFVVLHATNQSLKKPREAWWFSGGSSPKRSAITPLAAGTEQLVLADLDLDRHVDVIALSPSDARLDIVYGSGDGNVAATVTLHDVGCSTMVVADFSGDARDDVACIGDRSALLQARAERAPVLSELRWGDDPLRSPHTADLNADGKLDLIGYVHPEIVRMERVADDRFEPRLVAALRGASFSPLQVVVLDIDRDDMLDAVMLGNSESDRSAVDLVIVRDVQKSAVISVSDQTTALTDAPLLLTPALQ